MKLSEFQAKLKVPKKQYNSFGKYKYRSCEDILEAIKPIINESGFYLTITDEIVQIGDRYYVKAIASLSNGEKLYQTIAYAREELDRKGMDSSQITGAASSYARKYALNGLFAIDDSEDSDATSTETDENWKVDKCLNLLEYSALDPEVKQKTRIELEGQITAERLNKIYAYLTENVPEPIENGMNYGMADIHKKLDKVEKDTRK